MALYNFIYYSNTLIIGKKKEKKPALIEEIDILKNDNEIIKTSDKLPSFQDSWDVLYHPIEYTHSGLNKQDIKLNNSLGIIEKN